MDCQNNVIVCKISQETITIKRPLLIKFLAMFYKNTQKNQKISKYSTGKHLIELVFKGNLCGEPPKFVTILLTTQDITQTDTTGAIK